MLIKAEDFDWEHASDAHVKMLALYGSAEAKAELAKRGLA